MGKIHNNCSSVVFLWWHTARESLLWYRKVRKASKDIDMCVWSIDALNGLLWFARRCNYPLFLHEMWDCYFIELDGSPVSFTIERIYNTSISQDETITTSSGIKILNKTKLARCKLQRWIDKWWNYRGKDFIDIWNMLLERERYSPLDTNVIPPSIRKKIITCSAFNESEKVQIEKVFED